MIGGGFAGVECAHQLLRRGHAVTLVEMRPVRTTDAHATDRLAEMVCSNSFRSDNPANAVGLLKREMESIGCLVLEEARKAAVPAGAALAVARAALLLLEVDETARKAAKAGGATWTDELRARATTVRAALASSWNASKVVPAPPPRMPTIRPGS